MKVLPIKDPMYVVRSSKRQPIWMFIGVPQLQKLSFCKQNFLKDPNNLCTNNSNNSSVD